MRIDEDARTVSVPAATRYGDLARHSHEAGWALSNLPSPHISGRPAATATHGSQAANQLASFCGNRDELDPRQRRSGADRITPLRISQQPHLGALGVVTELTLAIEPTLGYARTSMNTSHGPPDRLIRGRHGCRLQRERDH